MEGFSLRFAPHLSFGGLDRPLFAETVGSTDPVRQIEFAAERGFAGVLDPFAALREAGDQRRIGQAVIRHGLECGTFVYCRPDELTCGWTSREWFVADELKKRVERATEIADRLTARHIAIIPLAAPRVPRALQFCAFSENLKRVVGCAERAGKILCLEAMDARRLPGMLLNHLLDAYGIVKAVDSPALRLAFDFAHVQAMDGNIIANLDTVWDAIGVIQLADNPGRREPGAGELNFPFLIAEVMARGYTGLLELEFNWSRPGIEGERDGLAALRRLAEDVRRHQEIQGD